MANLQGENHLAPIADPKVSHEKNSKIEMKKSVSFLRQEYSSFTGQEYAFYLELLEPKIALFAFKLEQNDDIKLYLIKHIFFNKDNTFYSLTQNDNEISLFIDQKHMDELKKIPNANCFPDYKVIKVFDSHDGISHIGIVSRLSKILADSEISILYVNSFNNNYILIEEESIDKARQCLENNNFRFH